MHITCCFSYVKNPARCLVAVFLPITWKVLGRSQITKILYFLSLPCCIITGKNCKSQTTEIPTCYRAMYHSFSYIKIQLLQKRVTQEYSYTHVKYAKEESKSLLSPQERLHEKTKVFVLQSH